MAESYAMRMMRKLEQDLTERFERMKELEAQAAHNGFTAGRTQGQHDALEMLRNTIKSVEQVSDAT